MLKKYLALLIAVMCFSSWAVAEAETWRCWTCNEENSLNFCLFCGSPKMRQCPVCGWQTDNNAANCGECGVSLMSNKKIAEVKIGDVIELGHYEQDGNTANGKEPIEWLVLDVLEDRIILLAVNILDVQPYNANGIKVDWLKCSLRTWLNNDFRQSAFDAGEQKLLMPGKPFDNGFYTANDQIFLLDYESEISPIQGIGMGGLFIPENYAWHPALLNSGIEHYEMAPATAYVKKKALSAAEYYWERGGTIKENQYPGCFQTADPKAVYGVRPACCVSLTALNK